MDYFQILEIDETDDEQIIRQAYRRLAAIYHPDRNNSLDAAAKFRDVTAAYHVLSNQQLRSRYRFQRRYEQLTPNEATIDIRKRRPSDQPKPRTAHPAEQARVRQAAFLLERWLWGKKRPVTDWRDHVPLILARGFSFAIFCAYILDWLNRGEILQAERFSEVDRPYIEGFGLLVGAIALAMIGAPAASNTPWFSPKNPRATYEEVTRALGWLLLVAIPALSWGLGGWLNS